MSYFAKLTSKYLSPYLNKNESVYTFKKSLVLAPDRRSDCKLMLQNDYISLPYIIAARIAGIDRKDEITSLLSYIYLYSPFVADKCMYT